MVTGLPFQATNTFIVSLHQHPHALYRAPKLSYGYDEVTSQTYTTQQGNVAV